MAKRFTETEKWKDGWFLNLKPEYRLVWCYLLDSCTIAGRWIKNFKLLNFCCDSSLDEKSLNTIFNDRLLEYKDFFFIPKFLTFQYPGGLNSDKRMIVAIKNELFKYGLSEKVNEMYGDDFLSITYQSAINQRLKQDKDKDKDKVIKGVVRGGKFIPPTLTEVLKYCELRKNNIKAETFIDFYTSKGWMIGKNKMKDWRAAIRTWEKTQKERQGIVSVKPRESKPIEKIPEEQRYKGQGKSFKELIKNDPTPY